MEFLIALVCIIVVIAAHRQIDRAIRRFIWCHTTREVISDDRIRFEDRCDPSSPYYDVRCDPSSNKYDSYYAYVMRHRYP